VSAHNTPDDGRSSERRVADTVRESFLLYTEGLLRQMRSREGGSLRVLAFQVKDAMDSLVAHIDGQDRTDAPHKTP
jgi:hypothetical protein